MSQNSSNKNTGYSIFLFFFHNISFYKNVKKYDHINKKLCKLGKYISHNLKIKNKNIKM